MARIETAADAQVRQCLSKRRSFALVAGAGSGKTSSLVEALDHIRRNEGATLRRDGQRVACITYTRRAVEVVSSRLGFDKLYSVSTLHSFLWSQLSRFHHDIRGALKAHVIPRLIAKAKEKDNGGASQQARKAREQAVELEEHLKDLDEVPYFSYADVPYSDYPNGKLSHDDIIGVAGYLLSENARFRNLIGIRFPYIFVDEAQDTAEEILNGLGTLATGKNAPVLGLFGDPWQQIYASNVSELKIPGTDSLITKTENFRCAKSVIRLLNAFRTDVQQYAAGENKEREGSVKIKLIESEKPLLPRNKYSEEQIQRSLVRMDQVLDEWGWRGRDDIMRLYLVRQMIARRLGFSAIHELFTGLYSSTKSQEDYESGEHFALKPFIDVIWRLISAHKDANSRAIIDVLRSQSPAYAVDGPNKRRSLKEMIDRALKITEGLSALWTNGTVGEVLHYAKANELIKLSDRLTEHLSRSPRTEAYNADVHGAERSDWLCDAFFALKASELSAYCKFILENTSYSTQHGVKGEQYPRVLVVFDDIEAAWTQYSFTKLLTPRTSGDPTEGQFERGRKLAYVCFSRAEEDLRIVLFTPSPTEARQELIDRQLVTSEQISILPVKA